MKRILILVFFLLFASLQFGNSAYACTSVAVSRGASADGSILISWTYDVTGFMAPLQYYPGGVHAANDSVTLYGFREGEFLGRIKQAPKTYKVVGNMNENQVAISETTFTGREELHGGEGVFDYGNLIYTTLQRATSARNAIKIMDELARTYGYKDTGESFFIGDKNEVWVVEFIGKGKFAKGAVWVAARIPDGYMAAHANQARIRKINWSDPQNWMWADDIVEFAKERGWFKGNKNDFSFVDVYAPVTPRSLLLCESRVWSVFRRANPSAGFTADYWRCVEGAEPYPLFIRPDNKIKVEDMMAFHRDHFHNTPYFTGAGIASEPYGNPYRWRPVFFKLDGDTTEYAWERPVSQPQTAFSFISQARNWLPDQIGGICWYSVDDTYSTVWMPLYLGLNRVPVSLSYGSPVVFDWNVAFWVFSLLNNYAYPIFNQAMPIILTEQKALENRALSMVSAIDQGALSLYKTSPELVNDYLTTFSVGNVDHVVQRWRELAFSIFVKFNDRYVRPEPKIDSWPKSIGYPQEYLRRAVNERPGYYDARWRKKDEKID